MFIVVSDSEIYVDKGFSRIIFQILTQKFDLFLSEVNLITSVLTLERFLKRG